MISVKNLTKHYGDFSLNVSLEIPEGRITGLVGKNGAGKSTVIKSILGLVRPDGGTVTVLGKDAGALTPADKQHIGAALSDSGFSNYLTVRDCAKILEKLYDRFDRKAFLEACARYGLPENKQLQKFSTGMKAKLRVLVALSHGAKLLIMDEPTAGMDVEARNEILDILRAYLAEAEDRSVLITSHIATDLEGLCDDIYLIHNGKILLHEDTDVILSDYAVLKVTEAAFAGLDKTYLLARRQEPYGMRCLTNQKQFYMENYPGLVIEKCGIDDLILGMTGGK
ncbi:MAG: ABC transporter ATP-binding protein [Clostridiales bacterium]|nr:ABC transporter ATP-binding protein [Clostridiales bacterium]